MSAPDRLSSVPDPEPTVVQALAAVMEDVQAVAKRDRNTQQNFNFRGIDAVVNAVGPALRAHGVVAVPTKVQPHFESYQSKGGAQMRNCTLTVTWRFYGPAGDWIEAETLGEAADAGDKSTPKAASVAYRTLLLQALCIPTDDPDPDASTAERAVPPAADPQQQRETDPVWFDDVQQRVDKATAHADLAAIRIEANKKYEKFALTQKDAHHLKGLIENRETELGA